MFGLYCTRCCRPLTWPFSSLIFKEDGTEYTVQNKIPDDVVDGKNAVVVYMHKSCKRQGKYSAKMLRRAARMEVRNVDRKPSFNIGPRGPRPKSTVMEWLSKKGFDVSAKGHKFLMVFPRMMAEEVKKL